MHANWDPVAWEGAAHAALGNARPMAHKNRTANKTSPPVLMAQAPKILGAVVQATPVQVELDAGKPGATAAPPKAGELTLLPAKKTRAPPFLVIDMQHSRPWVLGPGRGKLGHGDLKQIPCYQPTHILGDATPISLLASL